MVIRRSRDESGAAVGIHNRTGAGRRRWPVVRACGLAGGSAAVAALLLMGSWGVLSAGEDGFRFRDFTLEVTPTTVQVCPPTDAVYQVVVGSLQGFSDPVTLNASGSPAGTTVGFSTNPVFPPGASQLTIGDTGGAAPGLYGIEVIGVAPTSTHTTTVFLDLLSGVPGAVDLVLPANGATDQLQAPRMEWAAVTGAGEYELQIATNPGFTSVVYAATANGTVHTPSIVLDATTLHYWRVRPANACGSGPWSATRSFTTGSAGAILLVDDDDDSPDVRGFYTAVLDELGLTYDAYDTRNSDDEPSQALLGLYGAVIWFSGAEYTTPAGTGVAGPGEAGEVALAGYLGGGGCLILSSQDYLWDHGLTQFGGDYLGIASYTSDVGQNVVTGVGSVFGGLGPYVLLYPFGNFSDEVVPVPDAELAFSGDVADAAVTRAGSAFRTVFLGFPLEALPSDGDRQDVLIAAFLACTQLFSDGFESGDVSRWSSWVP